MSGLLFITLLSTHYIISYGNIDFNLTLYVPCIILQCVDKQTRFTNYYKLYLFFIVWLYMFRTITSPLSGASSSKLYNTSVCSCYQESVAVAWIYITQQLDSPAPFLHPQNSHTHLHNSYIHTTARLACTIPTSTQQLDSPAPFLHPHNS